jgi:hypothetical protein
MGRILVQSEPNRLIWDSSYNRSLEKLSLVAESRIIEACSVLCYGRYTDHT